MARIAKLVVALLSAQLLSVAINGIGSAEASCDFSESCMGEMLEGSTLSANCTTMSSTVSMSMLDLNEKIANSNGQLMCNMGGGGFAMSCSDLSLVSGHTLMANCMTTAGGLMETMVDLDNCISNSNGNLAWC